MKKIIFMGVALSMVFAFTSCRSKESAYLKAYEKAQAAQAAQMNNETVGQQNTPVTVTPVQPTTTVTTTPTTTTTTTTPDYSNVNVRTENVTLVAGGAIKEYSVVVGSFGVKANAMALQTKLANSGYNAKVVMATVNGTNFYRVLAGTFGTKNEAASLRASLQAEYKDAWLLYVK